MNHKDIEPVTPGFMDKPPCYDIQCKRMEERNAAMERRLSAQPSPGASPTEDGLIEKALRVMGAVEISPLSKHLQRVSKSINTYGGLSELNKAALIHECKLYLREKGGYNFEIEFGGIADSPTVDLFIMGAGLEGRIDLGANTEVNAYAQAVLAASGQEIGQAETQEVEHGQ